MTTAVAALPANMVELTIAGILFVIAIAFTFIAAFREEIIKQCPSPQACSTCSPFRKALHVIAMKIDELLR